MPRRAWSPLDVPGNLLLLLAAWVVSGLTSVGQVVEGQVLVKYRAGHAAGPVRLQGLRSGLFPAGARRVSALKLDGWDLVELPPGMATRTALDWIRSQPEIEAVEPNHRYRLHRTPNDPEYGRLYGMDRIGAPAAWDQTQGDPSVVVAILDTGMDLGHPDLAPNLWQNPNEKPGNGVDDDQNGWVDDVNGVDVVDGDGDPSDDAGHGTHVAGIIGAVGGNERGVVGVAWKVRLLPVRVLSADGSATTAEFVSALDYLVRLRRLGVNVRVINCSWGGGFPSLALKEAMEGAASEGMLLVCSGGNDRTDTDAYPTFPAGYDIPDLITVGSSAACDEPSAFSNYGRTTVDVAAPGSGILSTYRGGERYGVLSGTSMSAPHVSGAAALLFGIRNAFKPAEVRALILGTADPVSGWEGKNVSGGRLNVGRAVEQARANRVPVLRPEVPVAGGRISVASRASNGRWGNGRSFQPALSGDGRWIAFVSAATNLVTGDREGYLDVFLTDRNTGAIQRVSQTPGGVGGAGDSESPSVSEDGRFVVFVSSAPNLVSNDINDTKDVFLWDRNSRQLELISLRSDGRASGNGLSEVPMVSRDGSIVVFGSDATDLVAGDVNQARDVFVRDRSRRRTERVNLGPGGVEAADWSDAPTISGDGRYIAFHSGATNLVAGDTNEKWDVFIRDRVVGTTEIVGGAGGGDDDSLYPLMSSDGKWLAFSSAATGFDGGATGAKLALFLYDRLGKKMVRAGKLPGGSVPQSDVFAFGISSEGRWVTFTSDDPGLAVGGELGFFRSYLYDRLRDAYGPIAQGESGHPAEDSSIYAPISADGRTMAFVSNGYTLVPGDGNAVADVFVVDRGTAVADLGVRVAGESRYEGAGVVHPLRPQRAGRTIAVGEESLYEVEVANGGSGRRFVLRAQPGRGGWTLRATVAMAAADEDISSALTGNGWRTPEIPAGSNVVVRVAVGRSSETVAESVFASLIEVRPDGEGPVLDAVSLVATGASAPPGWVLASRGADGYPAARAAKGASLSGDGSRVVFSSEADHLDSRGDLNLQSDVFMVDQKTGVVTRVSDTSEGLQANGESQGAKLSADGDRVAFQSKADNLVAGDSNEVEDIFVKQISTGTITRVSVGASGAQARRGSDRAVLSGDGNHVMFTSLASNLVEGDNNGCHDVFVRDLAAGTTECVSRSASGQFGDADSEGGALTSNGRYGVFVSYASNFGPTDRNRTSDVYLWDRVGQVMELISANGTGEAGNGASGGPAISNDGRWVSFYSYATDLMEGRSGNERQAYLLDRVNRTLRRVVDVVGALPESFEVRSASVSKDGQWLELSASAPCGAGGRIVSQVFAYDMVGGWLGRVSAMRSGEWGSESSFPSQFAAGGRYLAFESWAPNLVGEPSYPAGQVYVADLARPGVDALVRAEDQGGWRGGGAGTPGTAPAAVILASSNATGAAGTFSMRIQNKGNAPDRFRLRVESPTDIDVRVQWVGESVAEAGGNGRTRVWETPVVRPGAVLDVKVSVEFASAVGNDWNVAIEVESESDASRRDWVRVTAARDSDLDGMPDSWETRFFGGLGVAGVGTDGDGDGASDVMEWRTNTDPTRPGDALRLGIGRSAAEGRVRLTWRAKSGYRYRIERSSRANDGFSPVGPAPLEGTDGEMTWDEVDGVGGNGSQFYRLGVENP